MPAHAWPVSDNEFFMSIQMHAIELKTINTKNETQLVKKVASQVSFMWGMINLWES